jgi:hypothetical protein
MTTGRVKLQMINARGIGLGEPVDVSLRHMTTGNIVVTRRQSAKTLTLTGLKGPPEGLYRLEVDPASYLPVGAFANTASKDTVRLIFPVDPAKVRVVEFPAFADLALDAQRLLSASTQVLGFAGMTGGALWLGLDDIRRAGFLNVVTKAQLTVFANARSIASYFEELREVRGDRFFVDVPHELREEVKNAALSGLFTEVSSLLHHPPAGFDHAGSFKTLDRYGNLQVTFFTDGINWRADADIDDAGGLEHIFQVLEHTVTGRPTHPFDIHEILLIHQRIDPGYNLLVAVDA